MIIHHDVCSCHVRAVLVREFGIAQSHCTLEVFVVNSLGQMLGVLDSLHKRLSHNLVLVDSDEASLSLRGRLKNSPYSLDSLQRCEHSVVSDSSSTALNVSKGCDTSVKRKTALRLVGEEVLDLVGCNLGALAVAGAFGDDDDCLSLAQIAVLSSQSVS